MKKLKLEELGRISVDEFKEAEKLPVCIVLDNVRSLYNVGSVFRTADAAGYPVCVYSQPRRLHQSWKYCNAFERSNRQSDHHALPQDHCYWKAHNIAGGAA
jgi:hypothetical protein